MGEVQALQSFQSYFVGVGGARGVDSTWTMFSGLLVRLRFNAFEFFGLEVSKSISSIGVSLIDSGITGWLVFLSAVPTSKSKSYRNSLSEGTDRIDWLDNMEGVEVFLVVGEDLCTLTFFSLKVT